MPKPYRIPTQYLDCSSTLCSYGFRNEHFKLLRATLVHWIESYEIRTNLIAKFLVKECNDPHDKIYAIKAIFPIFESIPVDYNMDIYDLYLRAAKAFLGVLGLGLFHFAPLSHREEQTLWWVPDWRCKDFKDAAWFQDCHLHYPKDIPSVEISDDHRVLAIQGENIDTVGSLISDPFPEGWGYGGYRPQTLTGHQDSLLWHTKFMGRKLRKLG